MRRKNILIIILCIGMLFMVVAYSAFSSYLSITSSGNIASTWDIYFESITTKQKIGNASNKTEPYVNNLSAYIDFEMKAPGDKLVYDVVLKNNGTLDAVVNNITATHEGTRLINYQIQGIKKGDVIPQNSRKTVTITVEFDVNTTSAPGDNFSSLEVSITCVQNAGNVPSEDLIIDRVENTLVDGQTFSKTVKNLANNSTSHTYSSSDTKITYIGFYEYGLPEGYTKSELLSLPNVSVSSDNSITAYNDNGRIYVYSENPILANASMYSMFRGMKGLIELDFGALDTSNTTSFQGLFKDSSGIINIDFTGLDTSKVTNMTNMFQNCTSLKSVDFSGINTSNVTAMNGLFAGCSSLTSADLSSFNTSKVTTMQGMFDSCSSLASVDISSFDTSKVTNMENMFAECSSLKSIDLTGFNTSSLTYMAGMFGDCSLLVSVDISSFDTSKVTNMSYMFQNNGNLKTIYVGNGWSTAKVTNFSGMFNSCTSLVGGNGTVFSSNNDFQTYARVDTASTPGYLTLKNS